MYDIGKMTVKATPEEIIRAFEDVFRKDDFLGERLSCLEYLPYEHVKPYLRDDITANNWKQAGDEKLRAGFEYYRDWWREKIINERGISVHRGKEQFAIRMMLAGLPEWKELWDMDGGYYQRDAWNYVAGLFGFEEI